MSGGNPVAEKSLKNESLISFIENAFTGISFAAITCSPLKLP